MKLTLPGMAANGAGKTNPIRPLRNFPDRFLAPERVKPLGKATRMGFFRFGQSFKPLR